MQNDRSFFEEGLRDDDLVIDLATDLALWAILRLFDSRGEKRRVIQLNNKIWEITARELAMVPEERTPDV